MSIADIWYSIVYFDLTRLYSWINWDKVEAFFYSVGDIVSLIVTIIGLIIIGVITYEALASYWGEEGK